MIINYGLMITDYYNKYYRLKFTKFFDYSLYNNNYLINDYNYYNYFL